MRRRLSLAVLALAAASGVVVWKPWAKPASTEGLALPPLGKEVVMHVVWQETSTARLAKAEAAGLADVIPAETHLDADLVLAHETTSEGGDAVRAELRDVRSARVKVLGSELDTTQLANHPIHFVIENGKIARVLLDKNTPSLAASMTENVARQLLLPRPKAGAFDREEETPAGTMNLRYEPKGSTFRRTIIGTSELTGLPARCDAPCAITARGEGQVEFEDNSAVLKMSETHNIRAGMPSKDPTFETKSSFEASRVKEGKLEVATVSVDGLASKAPSEPFESEPDRHASLQRQAEGASIEDILGGISTLGTIGSDHLPKGWLVRSTALLELEPKLLNEVAVRFEDDGVGPQGRLAILDVLAATGGDAAKIALLDLLNGETARRDSARLSFVQRLMLVEHPNGHMIDSIRGRLAQSQADGDSEMAYAEAHVLGAMAGRAKKTPEAQAGIDALAKSVDTANAPAARAAYVSALGNAGAPSQIARITKHAADPDASVRRSVASALRKTNEPSARATLVTLARDQNEEVQVAAVDALSHNAATPAEQHDLAQLLESSSLGGPAEGQVVTALLRQGPPSTEVRGSLQQVLARTEDPRLAARIRFALETSAAN
jgi:hypothetical protein